MKNIRNEKGITIIVVVIVIAAVSLMMVKSISFLSIGELEMGDRANQGEKSLQIVDACLEEILQKIRRDYSYLAIDEEISISGNVCTFSVQDTGLKKSVVIENSDLDYKRKVGVLLANTDGRLKIENYVIGEN